MKKAWLVNGLFAINEISVKDDQWSQGTFTHILNGQPIIVLVGGWNKMTTYGAFGSQEEAISFCQMAAQQSYNADEEGFIEVITSPIVNEAFNALAAVDSIVNRESVIDLVCEEITQEIALKMLGLGFNHAQSEQAAAAGTNEFKQKFDSLAKAHIGPRLYDKN